MQNWPKSWSVSPITTLKWQGDGWGHLILLDQRKLPQKEEYLVCEKVEQLWEAIRGLAIRGAPAIGIGAAYGAVLAAQDLKDSPPSRWEEEFNKKLDYLNRSRPTAVNLAWAIQRQRRCFRECKSQSLEKIVAALLAQAEKIHEEDRRMCQSMAELAADLLPESGGVLTHCNTGFLATGGIGTALGAIYQAWQKGKRFVVYATETRPLLQGSRLTAWELQKVGIPTKLICDNMTGFAMAKGRIQAVIVGADRITRRGDVANKIGTYTLAILAKHHGIPFFVVAPSSTLDFSLEKGSEIPIEKRSAEEIRTFRNVAVAPKVETWNPAFDVTPAELITAIITEGGVFSPSELWQSSSL